MAGWIGLACVVLSGIVLGRWSCAPGSRRSALRWLVWAVVSTGVLWTTAGSYELRKTVGLALMPPGLLWLALGAWAAVLLCRGRRRQGLVALIFWLGIGAAGNLPLGCALLGWLERPFISIQPLSAGPFDAIAVLGGGVAPGPAGRAEATDAGDRVVLAAEMARSGRTDYLVVTGPVERVRNGRTVNDAAAAAHLLMRLGVPSRQLIPVPGPRTTEEEVAAMAALARQRRWRRLGLITSAWHMRRALAFCRRAGLEVEPLPADFRGPLPHNGIRNVIPQGDGFSAVQHAAWELLGGVLARMPAGPDVVRRYVDDSHAVANEPATVH